MMYGDTTTLSPLHLARTPRNLIESDVSGEDPNYGDSEGGVMQSSVDSDFEEMTTDAGSWGWKIGVETTEQRQGTYQYGNIVRFIKHGNQFEQI